MLKHWFRGQYAYRRQLLFEQLEDRIVLDAAVAADAQNTTDNTDADTDTDQTEDAGQSCDPADATEGSTASAPSDDPLAEVYSQDLGEVLISNVLDQVVDSSDSQEAVRVLVVSSSVEDADILAEAAQDDVVTIVYDGSDDSPAAILSAIEDALAGREAQSIAFAAHDLGEGCFHLTGGFTVSPSTILSNTDLQSFWQGVGDLLTEDGRIDIMACDLASTDAGDLLISQLESLTGHDVAASDDATGNPDDGGDWILETDNVDLVSLYFVESSLDAFDGTLAAEDKLTPSDVEDGDDFGYSVSIDGDYCIVGARWDDDGATNTGAAYIYELVDGSWVLAQKITASDAAHGDRFGFSVSIDGDYCIVGAYQDDNDNGDNAGSAYIYHLVDGTWDQEQKITASDGETYDYFGGSVSIDGDYCIVGAYKDDNDGGSESGAAYIYKLQSDGTWGQEQKITASDGDVGDYFGSSVSIDGDYCIVGSYKDEDDGYDSNYDSGAAYIYELQSDGTWDQEQKITASDAAHGDRFGFSVSIDGDYCIVGAYQDDNNDDDEVDCYSGAAYIYELQSDGTWVQAQKITATDASDNDRFGFSVSVSGDYCVVGAYGDDEGDLNSGSAYIYELQSDGTWVQAQKITATDGEDYDHFGWSVSIDGDYCIVGAYCDVGYNYSQSAYVYYLPAPSVDLDASAAGIGYDVTFAVGGGAVDIAGDDVSITDQDDAYLDSVTVTLTNPLDGTEEGLSLSGAAASSLVVTDYDPDTGTIIISGHGTLAEYEAAIELIQYYNNADSPSMADRVIQVQADDGANVSDVAISTVTVNHNPVAVDDDAGVGIETDEDTPVSIAWSVVLDNDSDVDLGDILSVSGVSGASAAGGLVTYSKGSKTITYDPNGQFDYLAPGETATDTFTYTISDGDGGTDTATVTVTVIGVNDHPEAANDDAGVGIATDEDTAVTFATSVILANDYDVDNGDSFSTTGVSGTSAAGALVTLDTATDEITYNPNGQFDYLAVGETVTDTFTYTITDSYGGTDTATVTVTVTGVNDNPVAIDDDPDVEINIDEATSAVIDASALLDNDSDVDASDVLSVTTVSGVSAAGALVTLDTVTNQITYDTNGQFDNLTEGESATDTFTYTISDGNGGTDTATVTVTIINTKDNVVSADDSKITAFDGYDGDYYGYSVSIDGNHAVVGAYKEGSYTGSVYIYEIDEDGNWINEIKLTASDGEGFDYFGYSVCISGDYIIVGAYGDDDGDLNSGAVYIYKLQSDGTWGQEQKITADDAAQLDRYGCSVSIDGDYCIVGAYKDDNDGGSDSGAAYIYKLQSDGTTWAQTQKITVSESGSGSYDYFGNAVSIDGDYCIVGAYAAEEDGSRTGSAYIYELVGGSWVQAQKITASDASAGDNFGYSVSIDGDCDYCIVGAYGDDDDGSESGSAYIYELVDDVWTQKTKLTSVDASAGDYFGYSVSLDGEYCIVGAYGDDDNGSSSGSAYTYQLQLDGTWGDETKWTADDGEADDYFGCAVSISGEFALVGAYGDDDKGPEAGAAYLIHLTAPNLDLDESSPGTGYTAYFAAGGDAVDVADDDVSITDQDDANLDSVTITLTNPLDGADEGLSLSDALPGSLTLTTPYDSATGELVISGEGTLAEYQAAIELVQYYNNSGSPDMTDRSIEVTVYDGEEGSNIAVSVVSVTNSPVAVDDAYGVAEDASVSGNVITDTAGKDSDPDGDTLTATLLSGPAYGTLTAFNEDGSFTYVADGEHWDTLTAGTTEDVTFTYAISDGKGGSDNATVTITVSIDNDDPDASDDTGAITEPDTTYTTDVLITDPDTAYGNLSVNVSGSPSSTGTLTYNDNGTFTYVYTGGELAQGQQVNETFTYSVEDTDGATNSGTIAVTVTGANDDPVATDDGAGGGINTDEDTATTFNTSVILANDYDVDPGDIISVTSVSGSSTAGALISLNAGAITYDPHGQFDYLAVGETATDTFTYTITDNHGATDTATVTVTITGVNDIPVSADNTATTDEDVPYVFQASDFDFTDADSSDTLQTAIITDLPGAGVLYWNNTVVEVGNEIPIADVNNGGLVFESAENAYGAPYDSFGFKVSDGTDTSATSYTMTVDVADVNDAPVVSGPAGVTLPESASVDITGISISDADVNEGSGEIRVTLSVDHGTLKLAQTAGLSFGSGSDDSSDMAFTGLLNDVNDALATVTYTQEAGYHGNDSLDISADDMGNFGGDGPMVVDAVIGISIDDGAESNGRGNTYSYDSSIPADGASDTGPFSASATMVAVGNLFDILSGQGLLLESLIGDTDSGNPSETLTQFGALAHSALFGDDSQARNEAWGDLSSFVSDHQPGNDNAEWLGLTDFLWRLREWQVGKTLDEILLAFNANEIKLAEWFNELMGFADALGAPGARAMETDELSWQSLSAKSRVFDMAEARAADLFLQDLGDYGVPGFNKACMKPSFPVCSLFDLDSVSFLQQLTG